MNTNTGSPMATILDVEATTSNPEFGKAFQRLFAEAFDTVLLRRAAQAGKQGKPMAEVSTVLGRVKEAKLGKSGAPVPRGSQRLMPGSHSMRGGKKDAGW